MRGICADSSSRYLRTSRPRDGGEPTHGNSGEGRLYGTGASLHGLAMIQVVAPPWAEMKDFSSLRSLVNHTWLTHCILLPTQSDIEARGLPIWRNERARWVAFQAQSVQLQERLASVTLSRWAAQTPWLAGLPQHVRDSLFGMIEAQSDVAYSVEKIGSEYSVRLANLWAAATVFFWDA